MGKYSFLHLAKGKGTSLYTKNCSADEEKKMERKDEKCKFTQMGTSSNFSIIPSKMNAELIAKENWHLML